MPGQAHPKKRSGNAWNAFQHEMAVSGLSRVEVRKGSHILPANHGILLPVGSHRGVGSKAQRLASATGREGNGQRQGGTAGSFVHIALRGIVVPTAVTNPSAVQIKRAYSQHKARTCSRAAQPEQRPREPLPAGKAEVDKLTRQVTSRTAPSGRKDLPEPPRGGTGCYRLLVPPVAMVRLPNLGYACLNKELRNARPSVYITRGTRKAVLEERGDSLPLAVACAASVASNAFPLCAAPGIAYASSLALSNCQDLLTILTWNEERGIRFFRVPLDMLPWCDQYRWEDLPDYEEISQVLPLRFRPLLVGLADRAADEGACQGRRVRQAEGASHHLSRLSLCQAGIPGPCPPGCFHLVAREALPAAGPAGSPCVSLQQGDSLPGRGLRHACPLRVCSRSCVSCFLGLFSGSCAPCRPPFSLNLERGVLRPFRMAKLLIPCVTCPKTRIFTLHVCVPHHLPPPKCFGSCSRRHCFSPTLHAAQRSLSLRPLELVFADPSLHAPIALGGVSP